MKTKYSFHGLTLRFPVRSALSSCAKEIEESLEDVETLHFSIHRDSNLYVIDLRVVSEYKDILSTIKTKNITEGLKSLKDATIDRLGKTKNRIYYQSTNGAANEQLEFSRRDLRQEQDRRISS